MRKYDQEGAEKGLTILTPAAVSLAARQFMADDDLSDEQRASNARAIFDLQRQKTLNVLTNQKEFLELTEELTEEAAMEMFRKLREIRVKVDRNHLFPQEATQEMPFTYEDLNITAEEVEELLGPKHGK